MKNCIILIFLFFSHALIAGPGYFNLLGGAKTLALNGLNYATHDGLYSVQTNPAGLSSLSGNGIRFSVIDRSGRHGYKTETNEIYRSYPDHLMNFDGGLYTALNNQWVLGLHYGRTIHYDVNWPYAQYFKTTESTGVLTYDLRHKIRTETISPAVSLRLERVTFGLAVQMMHIAQKLSFPLSNSAWYDGIGSPAYQMDYQMDGWGFGINAGCIYEISTTLKVGFRVNSATGSTLEGTATSAIFAEIDSVSNKSDISAKFETPWDFGMGINYRLGPQLTVNIDFGYMLWNRLPAQYNLQVSEQGWQDRLSATDSLMQFKAGQIDLNYNNSMDIGFGISFRPAGDLEYRAGYRYSQTPNSDKSHNFLNPGVDQNWLTGGIGYLKDEYVLDLGLAYAIGPETRSKYALAGTYSSRVALLIVSLTFRL